MQSARKAVVCVFDGLRPDRVTADLMPNLHAFAHRGVWFREARSVFPSVTRVATASFATGTRPVTHGIVNNVFHDPRVFRDRPVNTASFADLRQADRAYAGRFVAAESLGCALAAAGKSFAVVHTGSAGSAFMVNHRAAANGSWTYSVHGAAATQTPQAVAEVEARFGAAPQEDPPKFGVVDHAATVFIEHVLACRAPDVALIWFVEPDSAYHYCTIASDDAIAVSRRVDAHFGDVLDAVSRRPDGDETLVVALSDHGHLSVVGAHSLFAPLAAVGLVGAGAGGDGARVKVTSGVASGVTLAQPGVPLDEVAAALIDWPQTGMLFSRPREGTDESSVEGTLSMSLVGVDHSRAPDLYWVARACADGEHDGLAGIGEQTDDGTVPLGGGMHGGLTRSEMNTTLVFGGAGVPRTGAVDDLADLTDIVPTVLAHLGVAPRASMTGRPLAATFARAAPAVREETVSAVRGSLRQSLRVRSDGERTLVMDGAGRTLGAPAEASTAPAAR